MIRVICFVLLLTPVKIGSVLANCISPLYYAPEPTTPPVARYNCGGSHLVHRAPTEQNSHIEWWCQGEVGFWEDDYKENSTYLNFDCKTFAPEYPLVIPMTVESKEEADPLVELLLPPKWSILVDGRRKPECLLPETFDTLECASNKAFEFFDGTDSEYIFNNWAPGQPNHQVFEGFVEACISMDYNGQFYDVFCDFPKSPVNSDEYPLSVMMLCGIPAPLAEIET